MLLWILRVTVCTDVGKRRKDRYILGGSDTPFSIVLVYGKYYREGGFYVKNDFLWFLRNARLGGLGLFTAEEKEQYLKWLDMLIEEPPKFSRKEIIIICHYINRSMGLYLRLTGLCGKINSIRIIYDGCMENLLFILDFILNRYYYFVSRKYIEGLYKKALNFVRFSPFFQKELIAYEIETGLVEKIYFYLEYYY